MSDPYSNEEAVEMGYAEERKEFPVEDANNNPLKEGTNEAAKPQLDADTIALIKQQIIDDMKREERDKASAEAKEREEQKKQHEEYVARMKASKDPWVDIQGWVHTDQGVKVELDWNDAFVAHLRKEGVKGTDDDAVVQMWVTLLLRDMADRFDDESGTDSEFE